MRYVYVSPGGVEVRTVSVKHREDSVGLRVTSGGVVTFKTSLIRDRVVTFSGSSKLASVDVDVGAVEDGRVELAVAAAYAEAAGAGHLRGAVTFGSIDGASDHAEAAAASVIDGSFTGALTASRLAPGLAQTSRVPVYPVSSFKDLQEPVRPTTAPKLVLEPPPQDEEVLMHPDVVRGMLVALVSNRTMSLMSWDSLFRSAARVYTYLHRLQRGVDHTWRSTYGLPLGGPITFETGWSRLDDLGVIPSNEVVVLRRFDRMTPNEHKTWSRHMRASGASTLVEMGGANVDPRHLSTIALRLRPSGLWSGPPVSLPSKIPKRRTVPLSSGTVEDLQDLPEDHRRVLVALARSCAILDRSKEVLVDHVGEAVGLTGLDMSMTRRSGRGEPVSRLSVF